MHRFLFRFLLLLAVLFVAIAPAAAGEAELRGIWMHATQIKSPGEAEKCIDRVAAGRLNAVFLLVWYWGGQAFFETSLSPRAEGLAEGYDPLELMVRRCHDRGIEVHAWFVNGAYGAPSPRHILDEHPEWAVQSGGPELWYDLGKPEVRRFQSDLMIDCLRRYDIDGLHFDYIRYGPILCRCSWCEEEFAKRYGREAPGKAAEAFPVVTTVSSNPVAEPTTASVLVRFSSGLPAIALNRLEKGEVLLFNWHAEELSLPAAAEVVRRALARWAPQGRRIHALETPENRSRYGRGFIDKASRALEKLGNKVETIEGAGIAGLPEGAVLVLPDLYIIPADVAEELERFVRRGGRAIVFDGPVLSMNREPLQRVLGFKATRSYFHAQVVLEPVGDSELVPAAEREIDVEAEKRRWADWLEYRKWGVTQLVRDVHARARQLKPRSLLTAAVFTPLASADAVCQDWPGWLEQGIIDLCIPMAYTESDSALETQIAEWKTLDPGLSRIVPGLSIYRKTAGGSVPRDAATVLRQRQLCEDAGAHGNVFFSLHHLTPELTTALTRGPFSDVAPAYRPAEREAGSRAGR